MTKKPNSTNKCNKWSEKWPKPNPESNANKEPLEIPKSKEEVATTKRPPNKTLRNWASTSVKVDLQDLKMIKRRTIQWMRGKSLTKLIILEISLRERNKR